MSFRAPLLLALSIGLSLAACNKESTPSSSSQSGGAQAGPATVQHLDGAAFKKTAEEKQGLYLDVRTPGEIARGQIPGASNIDFNDPRFDQKAKSLDKKRPLFVYCASGGRSSAAAKKLVGMGFEQVYELSGGIGSWKSAGFALDLPTEAPPAAPGMSVADFDAAIKADNVVLVDFQTPWCTPCKQMAPIADELATSYAGKAKVLRVDVDASEAVATREKIEGVPVFVLYVGGKERWRNSGATTRAVLAQKLDEVATAAPAASGSASAAPIASASAAPSIAK